MADWISTYLGAGGYPDTPQNRAFLSTWQHWEGGATNNAASFNYMNTTWNVPGSKSINSVGVKAYNSLPEGASAWASTLKANKNYAGLDSALKAGNPYTKASVPGLSTWLSGSPNSTHGLVYAQKVLGTKLAPAPIKAAAAPSPLATSAAGPSASQSLRAMTAASLLQQSSALASGAAPGSQMTDLYALALARQQLQAAHTANGPMQQASTPPAQHGTFRPGDPVASGTSIGGEHPTEGLAGFPARDYFAPAGSSAVAPITGKVVKLSGHNPLQGPIDGPHGPLGWSVYIQGTDGHTYYMTHMGSRNVQIGQTVKAGQPIGTVADYAKYGTPSHIHMGVH